MQPFNKFNVASLLWKHGRGAVGILGPVEENIAAELNEMVAQELEATPARDADGIQLPQAARVTDAYSIEPHGNAWALYLGRDDNHHGLNLCRLDDFDANGDRTRELIVNALNSLTGGTPDA
jgi:hypothetical protein